MKNQMIELESVGAVMVKGVVYPQLIEGGYDTECGVPLNECDEEWFSALSEEDGRTIKLYKREEARKNRISSLITTHISMENGMFGK